VSACSIGVRKQGRRRKGGVAVDVDAVTGQRNNYWCTLCENEQTVDRSIEHCTTVQTNSNRSETMKFAGALLLGFGGLSVHAFIVSTSSSQSSISTGTNRVVSVSSTQLHAEAKRRVVVTGLGVISGCGIGHDDFFQACLDGKSSLAKVQRFDAQYYPCQIASEVPDSIFNPEEHFINVKNVRSNDRFTHFAVAAARQALKDAGLGHTPDTLKEPSRIGVMVGTAFGGVETFEKETLKLATKPERPKVRLIAS
jgi:Beta-ketoacyl synthase, N-terminal domain